MAPGQTQPPAIMDWPSFALPLVPLDWNISASAFHGQHSCRAREDSVKRCRPSRCLEEMLRWTVHQKGPKRTHHAAVAVGHKVYSFGGYGDGETFTYDMGQISVHVFNTVSLRWVNLPPVTTSGRAQLALEVPSRRWGHTAALIEDKIYIWGGQYCNKLYEFDIHTHSWFRPKVAGAVPGVRWGHSACVLAKVMYILGGFNKLTGCTNDMYTLDTGTMVWSLINTKGVPVLALACHSATIIGTKMFVFGCLGDQHDYNIRVFDTETNYWLNTPSAQVLPERRWCHSALAYKGDLYIFGGHNILLDRTFNDLWKLNPETFSWKKIEPKGKGPCSWMYRMCCCMVGEHIILFGGYRFTTVPVYLEDEHDADVSDLHILDLSPSLKTLCKVAVIACNLDQSGLPHDIRWELAAMNVNNNRGASCSLPAEKFQAVPGWNRRTEETEEHFPHRYEGLLDPEAAASRAQECARRCLPTECPPGGTEEAQRLQTGEQTNLYRQPDCTRAETRNLDISTNGESTRTETQMDIAQFTPVKNEHKRSFGGKGTDSYRKR